MDPLLTSTSQRFALVGAGTVGTAVAVMLKRGGHEIAGVASRSVASATRTASLLGCGVFEVGGELPAADAFLVGTPDHAVAPVAESLAPRLQPGTRICHFAGTFGIRPLRAAVEAGAIAYALHPVQACPNVEAALARLPGSTWGVTCISGAWVWAEALIADTLEGHPQAVPEEKRPLWHAAAVVVSNGTAGLLALGEDLLRTAGIEAPTRILGPLASGTIANAVEGGGAAKTLTGPIARGEVETLRRHLASLEDDPEMAAGYRDATRLIVKAARRAGRLDAERADAMLRIVGER